MSVGRVVVVVPRFRLELRREEETSLGRLDDVLGRYERVFVAPQGIALELEESRPAYRVEAFEDRFFDSIASYSRLLLDPRFYRRFEGHEFLLIYQLDCLVIEDRLEDFLDLDVDYVGAPWLKERQRPQRGFSRVGNGGLSLRRVAAALAVLDAPAPSLPATLLRLLSGRRDDLPPRASLHGLHRRLRVAREVARGIAWYRAHYSLNEDHFWSDRAPLFDPSFRLASVGTGLDFAFDEAPRQGYEELGHLPFGCHGWFRRDRAFWEEMVDLS